MNETLQEAEQLLLSKLSQGHYEALRSFRTTFARESFLQGKLSLSSACELANLTETDFLAYLRLDNAQSDKSWGNPFISAIVPVYNEEDNLPALRQRLLPILEELGSYEVIFVNDGSQDSSASIILEMRANNSAIKLINFSRNFGHQAALSSGVENARGEVVALLDADLQDLPELLLEFVKKWREGYQVVYAVRQKRKESIFKRFAYRMFYRLLSILSNIDIPLDAGDFCLMDRCVVQALLSLPEKNRFLRGLRCWVGYRQIGVTYDRPARHAGEPKYTLKKLIKLAVDGLLSFTSVPLRLSGYLGFLAASIGIVYLIFAIGARVFYGHVPPGWTSLIVITLILGGTQLVVIGVLGEYLARVYDETKHRPMYIASETYGINE